MIFICEYFINFFYNICLIVIDGLFFLEKKKEDSVYYVIICKWFINFGYLFLLLIGNIVYKFLFVLKGRYYSN